MVRSWKSNDLDFKSTNERRMHELDKKLKLMIDKVMESAPVHKGIESMARNYVNLGKRMMNGKMINVVKKVA